MSYNSKRTGQEVENLLDKIEDKVDKVEGKQLSTEDFTTALKNKLNSLNNYDDSAIQQAVNSLRSDFDTLVSGDTTTAIKSFNDIIAFLNGIEDSESLDSIIASIQQQIAGKMDKVVSAGGTAKIDWYKDIADAPRIAQDFDSDGNPISPIHVFSNIEFYLDQGIAFSSSDGNTNIGIILFDEKGIHQYIDSSPFIDGGEIHIIRTGDGTKFLSDDGTYKAVSGGSGGGKEYVKITLTSGELLFADLADNVPLESNKVYYVDSFVSEGVSIQDVVPPTGDVGEYTVHFVCSGSTFVDTFEVPANWQWANGQKPTLENGTAYELSVVATKVNGSYYYKAVLTAFKRV